ncbi:MAG TPA: DUF1285 domain-containing protein [Spirochaetes bacterium]|nr:DUF1285 domain-containing protein [Spirochaetota bacterium]
MENDYPELPEYIQELIRSGEGIEEIRLDGEGNWFHNGEPFTNERIIDFFNRSVNLSRDGRFVLHYGEFVYPIVVEDTPVFVTGVVVEGFGPMEDIRLCLSTGDEEYLDTRTLYYRQESGLYCYVRNGRMPAKFKRSPSYQLLERLEESDDTFYLIIRGEKIVLTEKRTD